MAIAKNRRPEGQAGGGSSLMDDRSGRCVARWMCRVTHELSSTSWLSEAPPLLALGENELAAGLEQLAQRLVGQLVGAREDGGVVQVVRREVKHLRLRRDAVVAFEKAHAHAERAGFDLAFLWEPGEQLAGDLERGKAERRAFLGVGEGGDDASDAIDAGG